MLLKVSVSPLCYFKLAFLHCTAAWATCFSPLCCFSWHFSTVLACCFILGFSPLCGCGTCFKLKAIIRSERNSIQLETIVFKWRKLGSDLQLNKLAGSTFGQAGWRPCTPGLKHACSILFTDHWLRADRYHTSKCRKSKLNSRSGDPVSCIDRLESYKTDKTVWKGWKGNRIVTAFHFYL